MDNTNHPSSTPPLPIGEVVFIKTSTIRKDFLKGASGVYKHMSPKEIMKLFAINDKIAKIIKNNSYFNVDNNMIGYVLSERKKKDESTYESMFGYDIKWETLNKNLPISTYKTFTYESSLLAISDIVILDMKELYEEITGEKFK